MLVHIFSYLWDKEKYETNKKETMEGDRQNFVSNSDIFVIVIIFTQSKWPQVWA